MELVSSEVIPSTTLSLVNCFITLPLWKEIIEFIQKEKETLKQVRLVCKYLRNLISFYWKQSIPEQYVSEYWKKIKKFNFEIQIFVIINTNSKEKILEINLKEKENIHKLDERGNYPLIIASEKGYLEIVKILIKEGANINVKTVSYCYFIFIIIILINHLMKYYLNTYLNIGS